MTELTVEQLQALYTEAGKAGAEAAIKSFPTINAAGVQVTHDPADYPFEKFGDQLAAVKQATLSQGRVTDPRLSRLDIKTLGANELVGSEGGFLLEPSFAAGLLSPLHDTGPFSSRAAKLPIGPNANGVTVRAVDETDRATGSRWGGIRGYRLAEGGTKLATNPTFRLVELRLKKYAVLCYATEELLQDTTALSGIIQQGCSEELDFMVNDDILNGPGNAGPLGILVSGALVSVTKETGQTAATIVTENIFKMWARMHPRSKSNAVWYINTDVTPQLYGLALSVGTGGMPMYMAPGSLPNAPSGALLGRPVVETEFNPTLGTVGDIVLADMSQYAMIDRDVQAASSIHVQFIVDEIAFRFVYRCDGQPKIAKPLTPYKGTGTLSPFVALATRA
jgi:HK97 family phage major capsid protein